MFRQDVFGWNYFRIGMLPSSLNSPIIDQEKDVNDLIFRKNNLTYCEAFKNVTISKLHRSYR